MEHSLGSGVRRATAKIKRTNTWRAWEIVLAFLALAVLIFALAGCSTQGVTSADLERFTGDLAAIASSADAVPDDEAQAFLSAHALHDIQKALHGAVKASDLMTRVAKGAGQ